MAPEEHGFAAAVKTLITDFKSELQAAGVKAG